MLGKKTTKWNKCDVTPLRYWLGQVVVKIIKNWYRMLFTHWKHTSELNPFKTAIYFSLLNNFYTALGQWLYRSSTWSTCVSRLAFRCSHWNWKEHNKTTAFGCSSVTAFLFYLQSHRGKKTDSREIPVASGRVSKGISGRLKMCNWLNRWRLHLLNS